VTEPLRRGGLGTLPDGAQISWSVAEGMRGRRWRAVSVIDGRAARALLLELDRAGRMTRLEVTSAGGLLTLHPEPADGGLHGNVVRRAGIDHLAFAWGPEHVIHVEGLPLVAAAAAHRLAARTGVGEAHERLAVVVDAALRCHATTCRFSRLGEGQWRVASDAPVTATEFALDADGLPADDETWPLEL
jgi:hypothetical protein